MTNYKEKALYHCKRKMLKDWSIKEYPETIEREDRHPLCVTLYWRNEIEKEFANWEDCYNYLKSFTKTTKRSWVEDKIDCRLVIWDTDLEPEEQDCVDYMLEFFNYEKGSFELEELREILAENRDDENIVNACDILIKALIKHDKETIEAE